MEKTSALLFAAAFAAACLAQAKPAKIQMPPECTNPDGMAVDAKGRLAIAAPNGDRKKPGAIFLLDEPGGVPRFWFAVEPNPETGFAAPMGICFGPSGELYVCDCQQDCKGRLLCVTFENDRPAKTETVASGLENANGVKYLDGMLYLTQSYQTGRTRPDRHSSSALYRFPATARNIRVANAGDDGGCCIFTDYTVNRVKRGGLNGVAVSAGGIVYTGNYGDGIIWRLTPGAGGAVPVAEKFAVGLKSADGLCVDGDGNLYVADMLGCSAVRYSPDGAKTVLAEGCFDRPSEPCFWRGFLMVADYGGTTLTAIPLEGREWPSVAK